LLLPQTDRLSREELRLLFLPLGFSASPLLLEQLEGVLDLVPEDVGGIVVGGRAALIVAEIQELLGSE
jgi:hypothetical protein